MRSREWKVVYQTIKKIARTQPRPRRRPEYSDTLIVALYLWAVMDDKPQGWGCHKENRRSYFRPQALPSESRLSRRIRGQRCQTLLKCVFEEIAEVDRPSDVNMIDGRPFTVNGCTKDRQARPGRVSGGFARGYRLHQLVSDDQRVLNWMVTPMNEPEPDQAKVLIEKAAAVGELILGDAAYDANFLYNAAKSRGSMLVAYVRPDRLKNKPRATRNTPERIAAVEAWKHGIARYVYRDRLLVETTFGNQSSYAGGLGPLPAWVRTLPRVTRWIGAKLILYHARLRFRTRAEPS